MLLTRPRDPQADVPEHIRTAFPRLTHTRHKLQLWVRKCELLFVVCLLLFVRAVVAVVVVCLFASLFAFVWIAVCFMRDLTINNSRWLNASLAAACRMWHVAACSTFCRPPKILNPKSMSNLKPKLKPPQHIYLLIYASRKLQSKNLNALNQLEMWVNQRRHHPHQLLPNLVSQLNWFCQHERRISYATGVKECRII